MDQLSKCRFMNSNEFDGGVSVLLNKKIVIIGDGDQSRIIQNILLHSKEFKLCYFIKLSKSKRTKDKLMPKVNKINLDQFLLKKKTNYYFICSIANNYSRFSFVKMFDQKFKKQKKKNFH